MAAEVYVFSFYSHFVEAQGFPGGVVGSPGVCVGFVSVSTSPDLWHGLGRLHAELSIRDRSAQVLTFFFIGGASSCADLWSCQRVDGGAAAKAFRS